jgi:hypothetical protein
MQAADFEEGEPLRALGRQVDPTAEVIKSLQRPVGPDVSVPVIRALVMGVLSLGMLPLWRWHHRLRDRIWNQQAQLRQVADWLWWKTGRI